MSKVTTDEIKTLIEIFDESEWRELALQVEDLRLYLSRDPNSAGAPWETAGTTPVAQPPTPSVATGTTLAETTPAPETPEPGGAAPQHSSKAIPEHYIAIKAPNLGIFYRSPKPGAAPYVELGAEVDEESEVCLIEVMKLFTPVHARVRGTIREICIEDGEMVEHDQILFYVEPAA